MSPLPLARRLLPPSAALALAACPAAAQTSAPAAPPSRPSDLWDLPTLYQNKANPLVQEIKIRGRYQGQQYWLDSNQGQASDWENRRSRLGLDATFLDRHLELRLDAEHNPEFASAYGSLADAYLKWKPTDSFSLTFGKQKPQIGYYDWLQSTNAQPTFERSQIFGQLKVSRATAAVAQGKAASFTWQAGAYSTEMDREFGSLHGGLAWGAGLGYDAKKAFDLEKADWRIDWLHSDPQPGDALLNRYRDLFSQTLWLQQDRWGLVAEAFLALGGAPDAFGLSIQPTYDLIPAKIQLVARGSLSVGNGPSSLTLTKRYEAAAPHLADSRGSRYHSVYLGLQYFLHGDNLKVLGGAEWAELQGGTHRDFSSLTLLTGLRFSF